MHREGHNFRFYSDQDNLYISSDHNTQLHNTCTPLNERQNYIYLYMTSMRQKQIKERRSIVNSPL